MTWLACSAEARAWRRAGFRAYVIATCHIQANLSGASYWLGSSLLYELWWELLFCIFAEKMCMIWHWYKPMFSIIYYRHVLSPHWGSFVCWQTPHRLIQQSAAGRRQDKSHSGACGKLGGQAKNLCHPSALTRLHWSLWRGEPYEPSLCISQYILLHR